MTEDENTIPSRVIAGLVAATRRLHGGSNDYKTWTTEILEAIARQADPNRHFVCGIGLSDAGTGKHGEWLFDQTWYECPAVPHPGAPTFYPHMLEHLVLALESEWGMSDEARLDDFLKLAVSIAEHRVMIFQAEDLQQAIKACWTMMDAARRVRTGTDAEYLFACYVRSAANALSRKIDFPDMETFPFRFWRARLHGPLVPVPPA